MELYCSNNKYLLSLNDIDLVYLQLSPTIFMVHISLLYVLNISIIESKSYYFVGEANPLLFRRCSLMI